MKLIWEEDEEKESCCLRTKRNTWRGFWLEFRICKMWTFYQIIQSSFNSSQQDSVLNNNYFNQVARKLIPGVNCDYDENTPQRYHPGNTFIIYTQLILWQHKIYLTIIHSCWQPCLLRDQKKTCLWMSQWLGKIVFDWEKLTTFSCWSWKRLGEIILIRSDWS